MAFDQHEFTSGLLSSATGLSDTGYVYIPSSCQTDNGCRVHVVFHGCLQSATMLNETFVRHTGYNGWAEANNIVILYPQTTATVLNPKACFDWWGYTGPAYASKIGLQNAAVMKMVHRLSS